MNTITNVTVSTYQDILIAIKPFLPDSGSTIREDIIAGFDIFKAREKMYNKYMAAISSQSFGNHKPASIVDPNNSKFWLDDIIEKRMGGKRKGAFVNWQVDGASYMFDPYTGNLTKE